MWNHAGLPKILQQHATDVVDGSTAFHELPDEVQQQFRNHGIKHEGDLEYMAQDSREQLTDDYVNRRMAERMNGYEFEWEQGMPAYKYSDYQRLVPKELKNKYFEIGVTHPNQEGIAYRHYQDSDTPPGLIGHVRGSIITEPTPMVTGSRNNAWLKPGDAILEEIQSDAQKVAEQTGQLHQAHGTLTKAGIQHVLENGANHPGNIDNNIFSNPKINTQGINVTNIALDHCLLPHMLSVRLRFIIYSPIMSNVT
jgi:predicted Zn-dependent protease with MMP-like domain